MSDFSRAVPRDEVTDAPGRTALDQTLSAPSPLTRAQARVREIQQQLAGIGQLKSALEDAARGIPNPFAPKHADGQHVSVARPASPTLGSMFGDSSIGASTAWPEGAAEQTAALGGARQTTIPTPEVPAAPVATWDVESGTPEGERITSALAETATRETPGGSAFQRVTGNLFRPMTPLGDPDASPLERGLGAAATLATAAMPAAALMGAIGEEGAKAAPLPSGELIPGVEASRPSAFIPFLAGIAMPDPSDLARISTRTAAAGVGDSDVLRRLSDAGRTEYDRLVDHLMSSGAKTREEAESQASHLTRQLIDQGKARPEWLTDVAAAVPASAVDDAAAQVGDAVEAAAKVGKATLTDRALAVTVSNMLSSPRTLAVNLFSGGLETLNRPLLEVLEGRPVEAITDVAAMGRAIGTAWANAARAFVEGGDLARVGSAAVENTRPEAFTGKAGMVFTPALRALAATDQFVRTLNTAGAYAAAKRRGMTEEAAQDFAARAGARAVFEGKATPVGQLFLDARNLAHAPREGKTLGRFIAERGTGIAAHILAPFVRVPEEILTRGTKMLASPITDLVGTGVHLARGNTSAARTSFARWQLNSALALGIYSQVEAGNLTGTGPKDPNKRRILEEARDANGEAIWRPHSVRIGGRWFDYSGLGPLAVPMAVIASTREAYDERAQRPDATHTEMLAAAANRSAQVMLDASYIRTIGDLFKSIGDGRVDKALAGLLVNTASRAVPLGGLLATVGRADDEGVKEPQGFGESLAARLPIARRGVPDRVSPTTGKPQREAQDWLALLSPMRTTATGEPNAVASEVARLERLGHNVHVRQFGRDVTYAGERQSNEQRRSLQRAFGEATAAYVSDMLARPDYAAASDARKAQMLNAALTTAYRVADLRATDAARDPAHRAALEWAAVPQYEGVKGSPESVREQNLATSRAHSVLEDYRKQHGRERGEFELYKADPETWRLSQRKRLDADWLKLKRAEIDRRFGVVSEPGFTVPALSASSASGATR